MGQHGQHEQEDDEDTTEPASTIDLFFSALQNFARAGGSGATPRAGKSGEGGSSAARFGTVKKSCCLARKQQK